MEQYELLPGSAQRTDRDPLRRHSRFEKDQTALEIISTYSGLSLPALSQAKPPLPKPAPTTPQPGPTPVDFPTFSHQPSPIGRQAFLRAPTLSFSAQSVPTLAFDSAFECGNLSQAIAVGDREFRLVLNYDTETKGHTQWFYYTVRNGAVTGPVTFHIVNLGKRWSLFTKGLKPLVRSEKNAELGWHRAGSGVAYGPSVWAEETGGTPFYQLSFTYTFVYPQDTVSFCHSFPYPYSRLLRDLQLLEALQAFVRVDTLCETEGHSNCPLVTITENVDSYRSWEAEFAFLRKSAAKRRLLRLKERRSKLRLASPHKHKKAVILMARVHPGETCASFVVKGALDFLAGNSREARVLRHHFIFRVVPMLNPDGVIYGNTRTTLLGTDLNRRWGDPSDLLHPTISLLKRLIQVMSEEREIALVCDFHGHSTKRKVFMYGCKHASDVDIVEASQRNALIRFLPLLLSRDLDVFSYGRCRFSLDAARAGTARQVCFREFGIDRSYTFESSFYGPTRHGVSLDPVAYESIGRAVCSRLLVFVSRRVFVSTAKTACSRLRDLRRNHANARLYPLEVPINEAEMTALEAESGKEKFTEKEAWKELQAFADELNTSYSSDESDEGTESSDYSDSEPTLVSEPNITAKPQHAKPLAPPKPPIQVKLTHGQSPALLTQPEAQRTLASLKPGSSRNLAQRPRPKRSAEPLRLLDRSMQVLPTMSFENEQLRVVDAPSTHVTVARAAGGYRSCIRSRDAHGPTYSPFPSVFRLSRIRSTLNIEKKLLCKPESRGMRQRTEEREEAWGKTRVEVLLSTIM